MIGLRMVKFVAVSDIIQSNDVDNRHIVLTKELSLNLENTFDTHITAATRRQIVVGIR